MGPRSGLDDLEKRKLLTLPGLDPSVVQPVTSRYADCATCLMERKEIICDYDFLCKNLCSYENRGR
jgi:hypothetical protein